MTAPKSFKLAAKKAASNDEMPPVVIPLLEDQIQQDENGESIEVEVEIARLTANFPSDSELLLFMSSQGEDSNPSESASAMFNLLKAMFSPEDYRTLRKLLREGRITPDLLGSIIEETVEAWSGFPTQPQSASAPSLPTRGGRSTGRVQKRA